VETGLGPQHCYFVHVLPACYRACSLPRDPATVCKTGSTPCEMFKICTTHPVRSLTKRCHCSQTPSELRVFSPACPFWPSGFTS
jgi:hypothetical protein